MIYSRKIADLSPAVQKKVHIFIDACAQAGVEILITSTYRDHESQDALYAKGRTQPGPKVTNAKGGDSYHNWRVAFDFVPIVNGKACWDDTELFTRCGEIAERCGLEWAGRWKSFKELAHCQYTGGLSIADFKNGRTLA